VDLISQLSLTWTASAARSIAAPEKYEAYYDQESDETSTCQKLDRITW
jgi:hypothetical protein